LSAPIPSVEPSIIAAGDTLKFTKSFNDYPVRDGWALSYSLTALNRQRIDIAAGTNTTPPGDFLVYVPSATTLGWQSGVYLMVGWVTLAADRYEIYRKQVEIEADAASADAVDGRSWAQKALEKVETMLLDQSSRGEISYSINGRSMTFANHSELREHRDALRSEIAQSKRRRNGGRILARFRSPR
jgi:hypothetical protein